MKTLFDRLDSRVIDKLNQDNEKYPGLISNIMNDLKNNTSLDELKWGTVRYIHNYATKDFTPFDVMNIFEAFGY